MFPILSIMLFFQLGTPPAVRAPRPASCAEIERTRRMETQLLHLPLDRRIFKSIPVWDDKSDRLVQHNKSQHDFDSPAIPVLVLHLWATWCGPCKDEFPIWVKIRKHFKEQALAGKVRFVHIAMQDDAKEMTRFVKEIGKDRMPPGWYYFDNGGYLANNIIEASRSKKLPSLPITLWLGPGRTVRQAMVGSIADRMEEVIESTERLMNWVTYMRDAARKPLPPEEDDDVFTRPTPEEANTFKPLCP
jgi:thiol-disulfide isomerase/thioredoxin